MAQRISRAKAKLKASGERFAMPDPGDKAERLRSVLHVLYLLFNEGYATSSGPGLTRADLSGEAIRLTRGVRAALPADPEVAGLLALMLLTEARQPARTRADGELVPLADQDRARWDRGLIAEGVTLITEALQRGQLLPLVSHLILTRRGPISEDLCPHDLTWDVVSPNEHETTPMAQDSALGHRLRRKRRESSLTQEELASLSGVRQVMIAKIEQGRRQPRLTILAQLATALDIPLSELVDNRPRLDGRRDGASVLAIRDALLSPALLPGIDQASDHGEPTPLPQLRAAVAQAAGLYWAGEFAQLAAVLPALLGEARLTAQAAGLPAHSLLAQSYDLAAALMVHMGKEDLAALGAERAITAAVASDDELLHAILQGTYAWVLLHQGRLAESEQLAATVADSIEPSFTAPVARIAIWGTLLMTALAPAGRDFADYISLASAAAQRLGGPTRTYLGQSPFSQASVATQACHAYAVNREPAKALTAARTLSPGDLSGIAYSRHLLDVAQAHTDAQHPKAATAVLTEARVLAPVWFRHQGIARSLVTDLCEQQKRLSPPLRELAASVDPDWYAAYHRRPK
jgi:transcriptional regulator with XRE-family HTH domain